ncbi:hypothetical protein HDV00_010377 [Rhizophlyctis rosea]|nr:hypothetical protein HDV00_010377 [Rhizophlyctis rosea]
MLPTHLQDFYRNCEKTVTIKAKRGSFNYPYDLLYPQLGLLESLTAAAHGVTLHVPLYVPRLPKPTQATSTLDYFRDQFDEFISNFHRQFYPIAAAVDYLGADRIRKVLQSEVDNVLRSVYVMMREGLNSGVLEVEVMQKWKAVEEKVLFTMQTHNLQPTVILEHQMNAKRKRIEDRIEEAFSVLTGVDALKFAAEVEKQIVAGVKRRKPNVEVTEV